MVEHQSLRELAACLLMAHCENTAGTPLLPGEITKQDQGIKGCSLISGSRIELFLFKVLGLGCFGFIHLF